MNEEDDQIFESSTKCWICDNSIKAIKAMLK